MHEFLVALSGVVMAMAFTMILLAVIIGIPVIFCAGVCWLFCFLTGTVFHWIYPVGAGLAIAMFIMCSAYGVDKDE